MKSGPYPPIVIGLSSGAQTNDRNFLLRGEPPELEFTHDDRLLPRFGEPKESGREHRLAPTTNLKGTISDNRRLCQREVGFLAGLDICSPIGV